MNSSKGIHLASFLALAVISYCVLFYGLGDYGLWDPGEGRSGVIAKEMVASGNWVTLTRNGDPYYDKPALYFWLVALELKLLGLSELAVRLPSALAASLTVGFVYLWGCVSEGWKRGLWGGLVLVTSMEFVALGRFGNTDTVFSFFLTGALLYFLWWKEQGKGWIWPFYLFLALASLTKGPVGVLLPLLIVGIMLGLRKRWALLQEMHLFRGMGLVVLVSGSWYLLAALHDAEYIKTFLWDHNVLRFFTSKQGIDHPEPIYYLFLILVGGFLPWSFFLAPVLHDLWERRGDEGQEERLFLVVWAATVLVFFSLSRNKLGTYILPAFPPLALLTGDLLRQFVEGKEARPWRLRWILYASLVWLFLLFSIFPVSEMILRDRYPQYFASSPPLILASLFIMFAALGWVLRKERWTPWIVSFSSLWLVLWFYGTKAPEISELRGTRSLARIINGNAAKDYRVVAIRSESLSFYLSDPVQVVPHSALVESMLEESIPTIAVVKEKHLREMRRIPPSRLFVWKIIPSASALVANFPLLPAQDLGRALKR
ncbi:MAG: ArnT family glycosyltransferase [Candidatus Binatia bacterium]